MERLANFVKNNLNLTKSELYRLNEQNLILVNGLPCSLQYHLKENDIVTVNGNVLNSLEKHYFLYNKPIGVICSNSKNNPNNIANILNFPFRVYTVGRLDKDSHGLIILTNDGSFCHDILENESIEKEYIVKLEKEIDELFLNKMQESIIIKGKSTIPAKVKVIDNYTINVNLKDGKYHQIRELVKRANNKVTDLYRIRIGNYNIGNLEKGKIIELTL